MYKLRDFGFREMMDCRTALRQLFDEQPATFGGAAEKVVQFFYQNLITPQGDSACALVRFFKTHPYEKLDPELQSFARGVYPQADTVPGLRCLVLLATAGDEYEWNSRHTSAGHKAIPLASEKVVEEAPMISQLIKQLGIRISTVLRPDPSLLLDTSEIAHNVFHVPEAKGSPFIVAQNEFVIPYGIESVVGFGGMMTTGDLFATILFSKVPISSAVADHFKVIGLNLRVAMLPIARKPLFEETA